MQSRLFQVSRLRQRASQIGLGTRILGIQPHGGAEVQKRSSKVALRRQRIPEVVVRIEIIGSPRERRRSDAESLQPRGRSPKARRPARCWRSDHPGECRTASVNCITAPERFAFHLKKSRKVVVRFEILGIILNVVQSQRFLNRHARIDRRSDDSFGSTCNHRCAISSLARLPATTRFGG